MSSTRYLRAAGDEVAIRVATADDAPTLRRLAVLAEALPLTGEVLLATVDGEAWAAMSLTDGRAIADPLRPTASVRAMLALRRENLAA